MALDLWAREPGIHALQLAEEHRLALGRQAEQHHRDYGWLRSTLGGVERRAATMEYNQVT